MCWNVWQQQQQRLGLVYKLRGHNVDRYKHNINQVWNPLVLNNILEFHQTIIISALNSRKAPKNIQLIDYLNKLLFYRLMLLLLL